MKKVYNVFFIVVLAVLLGACSSGDGNSDGADNDNDSNANGTIGGQTDDGSKDNEDDGSGGDDSVGGDVDSDAVDNDNTETDTEYEACIDNLEECLFDDMETPCFSMKFIPIPLTDGSTYGPKTIEGGPYGSYVEWNAGEGTEFALPYNILEPFCDPYGVETFNEPDSVNAEILDLRGLEFRLYTIFRPACMKEGEKYPVITWANGTCGQTGGYASLLGTVASYGFVVIAANSRWTATGLTDGVMLRALDYAKALNEDPDSIFYERLDMDKIGAMGHSQGAKATANAENDPRIKALLFWNTGTSDVKPFINVSGDRDVGDNNTMQSIKDSTENAKAPGAWIYYHQVLQTGGTYTGHLVLMEQPERVTDMAVAWWKYILLGDEEAEKMFVGPDCGLCNRDEEFEYGVNQHL